MLDSKWIEILDKSNNSVYFNTLFKHYSKISENVYECTLDYNHFISSMKHFAKILKEYLDNELNNKNEKENRITKIGEKNLIEQKIDKLQEKAGKSVTMRLTLLFEINVNLVTSYKVFSVKVLSKNKKKKEATTYIEEENEWKEASSEESQNILQNQLTNNRSNTSMTDGSFSIKLS